MELKKFENIFDWRLKCLKNKTRRTQKRQVCRYVAALHHAFLWELNLANASTHFTTI